MFNVAFQAGPNKPKMANYKVEQIPSAPLSNLGEGPHWDIERQSLYYNDIYGGSIHRYDYNENKTYNCKIGKFISLKQRSSKKAFTQRQLSPQTMSP